MRRHSYSFFGQKTGLILDSADWSENYIFLKFLKKNNNGIWEKPSKKEGRNIKLNLLELVEILKVLKQVEGKWSTVHRFKGKNTPISIDHKPESLLISIPKYQKYCKTPEIELLTKLLAHILEEKIIHATGTERTSESFHESQDTEKNHSSKKPSEKKYDQTQFEGNSSPPKTPRNNDKQQDKPSFYQVSSSEKSNPKQSIRSDNSGSDPNSWLNELEVNEEFCLVPGEIALSREKAIAFQVENLQEIWIPRSLVDMSISNASNSGLWIKRWFVDKKIDDIFGLAAESA